uniref:Uncharacterized protein n=1 Tax=Anguilla anguilla TaxID=7936 RepID=A0A0E9RWD2_ANGAN
MKNGLSRFSWVCFSNLILNLFSLVWN